MTCVGWLTVPGFCGSSSLPGPPLRPAAAPPEVVTQPHIYLSSCCLSYLHIICLLVFFSLFILLTSPTGLSISLQPLPAEGHGVGAGEHGGGGGAGGGEQHRADGAARTLGHHRNPHRVTALSSAGILQNRFL